MFYNYLNSNNVKIINLSNIYLGPEMHQLVNDMGKKLYGNDWYYNSKLILDNNLFPLTKINDMLLIFNKIKLPPIKLKKYLNNYEIIDGRHRVVLSILHNFNQIPAIIIE